MKFTYPWLIEHLSTKASLNNVKNCLTNIGLEVESSDQTIGVNGNFSIVQIAKINKHPNADKLNICTINYQRQKLDIVCGASNVYEGMKTVYAPPGCTIPVNDMQIKVVKIRGVQSHGMLCSEYELGMSKEHEGIIDLPKETKVNVPFFDANKFSDLIEIGITPNRQDCLGVKGIARDLAAAGLGTLKPSSASVYEGTFKSPINVKLDFEKKYTHACPVFASRYIKNVKNQQSPKWLQDKLQSIGLKPISSIVDITNFILFDQARPLHAYDADKISGQMVVRMSKEGEEFLGLDENTYTLENNVCVIADKDNVLGVGGILGGSTSGCSENTKNVLIESALFDTNLTAATGKKMHIESDARYRNERGVDPQSVLNGIELATKLIIEICGGTASEINIAGSIPTKKNIVKLRHNRIKEITGVEVTQTQTSSILKSLGFEISNDEDSYDVVIPSWRQDVTKEIDLIEEIVRIKGYDSIPLNVPTLKKYQPKKSVDTLTKRSHLARRSISSIGFNECITWSFISDVDARKFKKNISSLILKNPISDELNCMRTSLLPNLLHATKKNIDRGSNNVLLFEVGPVFHTGKPGDQSEFVCTTRYTNNKEKDWRIATNESSFDLFDSKSDMLHLLREYNINELELNFTSNIYNFLHPKNSACINLKNKIIGYFGEIHPKILSTFGINEPIYSFEINLNALPQFKEISTNLNKGYKVSDYPPVDRDFAFIVDKKISADLIIKTAYESNSSIIKNVDVFDVFENLTLGDDNKSIAIKVRFQSFDKTFNDQEIEELCKQLISVVVQKTGGKVRS